MASEHWKDEPEAQDFPAARSYLSLLIGLKSAGKLVKALRKDAANRSSRHDMGGDIVPMLVSERNAE